MLNLFPLSVAGVHNVRWWNEYKTILCSKENVKHFCKTKTKKFMLHNLTQTEDQKELQVVRSLLSKEQVL